MKNSAIFLLLLLVVSSSDIDADTLGQGPCGVNRVHGQLSELLREVLKSVVPGFEKATNFRGVGGYTQFGVPKAIEVSGGGIFERVHLIDIINQVTRCGKKMATPFKTKDNGDGMAHLPQDKDNSAFLTSPKNDDDDDYAVHSRKSWSHGYAAGFGSGVAAMAAISVGILAILRRAGFIRVTFGVAGGLAIQTTRGHSREGQEEEGNNLALRFQATSTGT